MDEHEWLSEKFEADRARLRAVAYRMLGSMNEADDAVQETWLKLSRSDTERVENLGGWLTTVVSHVCLDMLRSRKSRREEPLDTHERDRGMSSKDESDPEQEMLQAESVGLALLVVLDALAPAERIAFVLHDLFDLSFDEIASIVGRSPLAARQLASRARRRVQGRVAASNADQTRQRKVVDAFLTASRGGDFEALLAVLDPDVVFQMHRRAAPAHGSKEARGASTVAKIFIGRAQDAQPALINGAVGVILAPQGQLLLVVLPTITDGKIVRIDVIAHPERLRQLDLAVFSD
jgi:RNA polymerase sigma factor (sigma-70 family)